MTRPANSVGINVHWAVGWQSTEMLWHSRKERQVITLGGPPTPPAIRLKPGRPWLGKAGATAIKWMTNTWVKVATPCVSEGNQGKGYPQVSDPGLLIQPCLPMSGEGQTPEAREHPGQASVAAPPAQAPL